MFKKLWNRFFNRATNNAIDVTPSPVFLQNLAAFEIYRENNPSARIYMDHFLNPPKLPADGEGMYCYMRPTKKELAHRGEPDLEYSGIERLSKIEMNYIDISGAATNSLTPGTAEDISMLRNGWIRTSDSSSGGTKPIIPGVTPGSWYCRPDNLAAKVSTHSVRRSFQEDGKWYTFIELFRPR